jgi:hypothetical protein
MLEMLIQPTEKENIACSILIQQLECRINVFIIYIAGTCREIFIVFAANVMLLKFNFKFKQE